MSRTATVPAGQPAMGTGTTAAPAAAGRGGLGRLQTLLIMVVVGVIIAAAVVLLDTSPVGGFTKVNIGDTGGPRPEVGQQIPDLAAIDADGKPVSLAALKGKGVWLTFGASWCVDCRAEAPDVEATYTKFKDKGLALVAVFIQEDTAAVKSYASRVGFDFTMVPDPSAVYASRFKILGLPTHYFIGPDGVIKEIRLGGLPATEMEKLAQSILP